MSQEIYENNSGTFGLRYYGAGASLALTALASIGGTAYLHAESDQHMWYPTVAHTSEFIRDEVVQYPIEEGQVEHGFQTIETKVPSEVQKTLDFKSAKSPYAREYANDPAANEVDSNAGNQLKENLDQLRQEGWTNFKLTIQGKSSAEDNLELPDAGVTTPGDKNKQLALKRQDAFFTYVQGLGLPADVMIEGGKPDEQQLEVDKVNILKDLQAQLGYDSVGQLIEAWNTGKELSPAANSTLTALLGDYRGVSVTIHAEKPGEEKIATSTKETLTCVIPVKEIITEHDRMDDWDLPFPKFVIIPIPAVLPFVRRRTGSNGGAFAVGSTGEVTVPTGTGSGADNEDDITPRPGPDPEPKPPKQRNVFREEFGCIKPAIVGAGILALFLGVSVLAVKCTPEYDPKPPVATLPPGGEKCDDSMPQQRVVKQTIRARRVIDNQYDPAIFG